jgi:hypothetical protein
MADLALDKLTKTYLLRDTFYDIIVKVYPRYESSFLRYIAEYRDKYSTILSSPYLMDYPKFSPEDQKIIFASTGTEEKAVKKTIDLIIKNLKNEVGFEKESAFKPNFKPHIAILIMLLKYYFDKKDEKKIQSIYHYIGYSLYWTIYYNYFRHQPRQSTMYYTINELSKKFILGKLGSIDALLLYAVQETAQVFKSRIQNLSDQEISYVIDLIKTRINAYMHKIANRYFENDEKKVAQFVSTDRNEEGETIYRSSTSGEVEAYAQEYTTKFFSSNLNIRLVKLAARLSSVNETEIKDTMNFMLKENCVDDLHTFYESIFYIFLNGTEDTSTSDIKSIKFFTSLDSSYKRGNTNNKNMITAKNLLDKWLTGGSLVYKATTRQATINNYRRAIYYYLVLFVSSNKD